MNVDALPVSSGGESAPSQAVEPIAKTGSSSDVTSFDELEALHEAKAPKEGKKEAKKADGIEQLDRVSKDPAGSESDRGKRKSDSEEVEGKAKGEKDLTNAQKAKLYRLRKADQELDISDDFEIEVMVDGKPQKVLVKDVVSEFSGKTNWGKKFQELDTERKGFQSEREKFIQAAKKLDADLKSGRPEAAIEYIAELAGLNPLEARQAYRDQMSKMLEQYSGLSPEEREQLSVKEELEYYRNRETARLSEQQNRQRVEAVKAKTDEVGKKYGVTFDEMKAAYSEIIQDGTIKLPETDEAQAAFVAEYAAAIKVSSGIKELVSNEFKGDPIEAQKIQQALLDEWFKDPTLTQSQINYLFKEVYGHKPASRLAQKAKTSGALRGGNVSKPQAKPAREVLSFDDLD